MTVQTTAQRRRRSLAMWAIALASPAIAAAMLFAATASGASHDRKPTRLATPALAQAGPFFLTELQAKLRGRWTAAWRTLYPPQQKVAPLQAYVTCERGTPFPESLRSVAVEGVRASQVRVLGSRRPVPGASVTVSVELNWYGNRDPIEFRHVFHLVRAEGRWAWLLSKPEYVAYRAGHCAG